MVHALPRGMLLDLDDTILAFEAVSGPSWEEALDDLRDLYRPTEPHALYEAIRATAKAYWADPDRHRLGRLNLTAARQHIVRNALRTLGVGDVALAIAIVARYTHVRTERIHPIPGALDTLHYLVSHGVRLALVTNGEGQGQRDKIERFGLAPFFQSICIEGECGFGKPNPRIYGQALGEIDVVASQAWMVGDNLALDVEGAQKLGIRGVWVDYQGKGLPALALACPDKIIRALPEILRD